jgi:hypothetical protein
MKHPKHRALYLCPYSGKWELRCTKPKSTLVCCVAWCKNPPKCFWRRGRIYTAPYCHKCYSRRWRANNPEKYAYEALKDSAKKRSIPFTLGFAEFKEWCQQTGYASQKGFARLTIHCDRIRDNEGYHINNIQVLSQGDNIRKQREREKQQPEEDPF